MNFFNIFFFVWECCVCVYGICTWACAGVHTYAQAWRPEEGIRCWVIILHLMPFRQGLLLNLGLGISHLIVSPSPITPAWQTCVPNALWVLEDPHSDPEAVQQAHCHWTMCFADGFLQLDLPGTSCLSGKDEPHPEHHLLTLLTISFTMWEAF